jgi:hypothetical protein
MKLNVQLLGLISDGIKNSLIIRDEVEKVAAERSSICSLCEFDCNNRKLKGETFLRPDRFCVVCGCNLHLKHRSLAAKCPLGDSEYPDFQHLVCRWGPELDPKKAEEIEETPELKKELLNYKTKLIRNEVKE